MNSFTWLGPAALVATTIAASACAQEAGEVKDDVGVVLDSAKGSIGNAVDATKKGAAVVVDNAQDAAEKASDATRQIADRTVDKTKEIASATGRTATAAASATGDAITDGWITTRIHGRFVDETLLAGSDIDVDTQDHAATLKGTVTSDAARRRAVVIARDTEGVVQVINQLVVRPK